MFFLTQLLGVKAGTYPECNAVRTQRTLSLSFCLDGDGYQWHDGVELLYKTAVAEFVHYRDNMTRMRLAGTRERKTAVIS